MRPWFNTHIIEYCGRTTVPVVHMVSMGGFRIPTGHDCNMMVKCLHYHLTQFSKNVAMNLLYCANMASMAFNSSEVNVRCSRAPTAFSMWLTLLAPIKAVVTASRRRTQAIAI